MICVARPKGFRVTAPGFGLSPHREDGFGPKIDRWLVKTVAGLLMVNGLTQLTTRQPPAAFVRRADSAWVLPLYSQRSTWSTCPPRRISKMYLVDAAPRSRLDHGLVPGRQARPRGIAAGAAEPYLHACGRLRFAFASS
jgi:hypothetical protein